MKKIQVNNTYDLNLKGAPSPELSNDVAVSNDYGLNLYRYNLKLRLLVKEGDSVKVGSPIAENKKDEAVKFLSPVSGTVKEIVFGEKRIISKVVIESDSKDSAIEFVKPSTAADLTSLSADDVASTLQSAGLWQGFVSYPFQAIPNSSERPVAIFVSLSNDEVHSVDASLLLKEYEQEFLLGLEVLKRLSAKVSVAKSNRTALPEAVSAVVTHEISGAYPANHPGVFLYHAKESVEENKSWAIDAQQVIRVGALYQTGQYPTQRVIVVAGELAKQPRHIKIKEGASLSFIKDEQIGNDPLRLVAGGLLSGDKLNTDDFLAANDYALNLVREGSEQEMFTFFRPGFDKATYGNTYLSALSNNENSMTTSLNGGERACISCGVCPNVCPVDLYPQVIMKSLYAKDIESAVSYGFLDCVQCGLCTHVCPSKIDMDAMFRESKDNLWKEVNR